MVLRRNTQYWSVIWIGVYFTAVMSDLGVNKLTWVQLIFRLFLMVFSDKKYKVSPEVASLKLVIWLWWLVIAFLPSPSEALLPSEGWVSCLTSCASCSELFLTLISFITEQCCLLVTDLSINVCPILPCTLRMSLVAVILLSWCVLFSQPWCTEN